MQGRIVTVDFSKKAGKLKSLLCSHALTHSELPFFYDLTDEYSELSVPTVRIGAGEYMSLGVQDVFPDFYLDPRFESSYNFTVLDTVASLIKSQGREIFLSLGERPDTACSSPRNLVPRDVEKWAEICVGIIRHLNEGWGNGFKYGVKQIEIWPGADSKASFRGTPEEYYELYSVTAKRLKERFPRLQIGGYSADGFYALNHVDGTEEQKRSIDFLEGFLAYTSEKKAPLDFLSWKCYATYPEELSLHANYAASYLINFGFKRAKSIVTEFNLRSNDCSYVFDKSYPAFLASSLISAEKSGIDMMFYSDFSPLSPRNALYSFDDRKTLRRYGAYGAASAYAELYRIGTAVDSGEDYRRELYTLAAGGKDKGALLLVTSDFKGQLTVDLKNCPFSRCSVKGMTGGGERGVGFSTVKDGISVASGRINLKAGPHQIYLISFE